MTCSLLEEFKKLSHVTTSVAHVHHPKRDNDFDYSKLAEADCVVFCGLPITFDQLDLTKLKEFTKYKRLVTFLERGLTNPGIDWAFEFKGDVAANTTFIPGPINKKLYKVVEKEPKSILLDHAYYNNLNCATHTLENWLEPLKGEYKVYRLISPDEKEPYIQKFVTPIRETTFPEYINLFAKMETFVVTHGESFGFSNLDACALGVRILTPPGFLCQKGLQDYFQFKTFTNREEFLQKLKEPIDRNLLDGRINKMTDYSQIIKIIDKKLRQFLLEEDITQRENGLKEARAELEETKK